MTTAGEKPTSVSSSLSAVTVEVGESATVDTGGEEVAEEGVSKMNRLTNQCLI